MKHHKPKVLRYRVKKAVEDSGIKVLWTPPYCLDLYPIELYWLAGKGNFSRNYYFGLSVKSTVSDLRDGWYGNTHCNPSGKMYLRLPEEDPFLIKVKKVDCFKLIKQLIKCANDRVATVFGISGSVDGYLHIDTDYRPTKVPETAIPVDTLFNIALNIEDDKDEHKYTSVWDMIRLDEKIVNFSVNSTINFDGVALLEVFSKEDEEGGYDWDVSTDI